MTGQRALPIVKGTVDNLVLKALCSTPMHGFEIAQWIDVRSNGALDIRDSALYQALHRLEERDLVVAEWGITENNQRARYYRITKSGRARLAAETAQWVLYAKIVTDVLTSAPRSA